MSELSVEIEGFEELVARFAQSPQILDEELRRAMRVALDHTEEQVAGRTPVNVGKLRGSIATEIQGRAVNIRGIVATPLIYGLPVERGRRPGKMPPVDAIEYWVIRKGIASPGPESRSVAFLIARAIGARGTKGAFMFQEGLKAATPGIKKAFEAVPERMIKRLGE